MKRTLTLLTFCLLAGASYGQAVPGGDMETWKSYSVFGSPLQRPDQWSSSDSVMKLYVLATTTSPAYTAQVTKESTTIHGGTGAARMETRKHTGTPDTMPGAITNGKLKVDLSTLDYSFSGGMAVSGRVAGASAWLRYTPAATSDSAAIYVMAMKAGIGVGGSDSVVGEGLTTVGTNSAFAKVNATIIYKDATVVPDHIIVVLFSSWGDLALPGSVLYADDAAIIPTSGVEIPVFNSDKVKVYPNPASGVLHISSELGEQLDLKIYSATGQAMLSTAVMTETNLDISSLPAGNYIYVLSAQSSGRNVSGATFIKQ